jgi:hypothetical protein
MAISVISPTRRAADSHKGFVVRNVIFVFREVGRRPAPFLYWCFTLRLAIHRLHAEPIAMDRALLVARGHFPGGNRGMVFRTRGSARARHAALKRLATQRANV